jgi:hypothetical protein
VGIRLAARFPASALAAEQASWPPRQRTREQHTEEEQQMASVSAPNAATSGTFMLGGNLPVHRLGFGAMRITGEGI